MCECVFVCMCVNARMPNCLASDQYGTGMKKLMMPGMVRYRTMPRQSRIFLVWYRTETTDAGMPIPMLVSSMPMPSDAPLTSLDLFQSLTSSKNDVLHALKIYF
jgi:hypothetical protein